MENNLEKRVKETYRGAFENGQTSVKKVTYPHKDYADMIVEQIGAKKNVQPYCLGINDGKEKNILGKSRDLYVVEYGEATGVIMENKFISSNLSQNSGNYRALIFGEAPIAKLNGHYYIALYEMPTFVPYLDNNGIIQKFEPIKKFVDTFSTEINNTLPLISPDLLYFSLFKFDNIDYKHFIGKSRDEYLDFVVNQAKIVKDESYNYISNGNTIIVNDIVALGEKYNDFLSDIRNRQRYSACIKTISKFNIDTLTKICKEHSL